MRRCKINEHTQLDRGKHSISYKHDNNDYMNDFHECDTDLTSRDIVEVKSIKIWNPYEVEIHDHIVI